MTNNIICLTPMKKLFFIRKDGIDTQVSELDYIHHRDFTIMLFGHCYEKVLADRRILVDLTNIIEREETTSQKEIPSPAINQQNLEDFLKDEKIGLKKVFVEMNVTDENWLDENYATPPQHGRFNCAGDYIWPDGLRKLNHDYRLTI